MNKIIQGDCLELMKDIEDKSVDMILCDLPYGTTACKWDKIIPFEPLWEQYKRIIRPNGFIILTASQPFTTKLISSNIEDFSHQWIWQKEQGANPLLANIMPMKNFEDVIVFYNEYKSDIYLEHPLREYFYKILCHIGESNKSLCIKLGHRKAEHSFYVIPKKYVVSKIGQKVDHCLRYGSTQFDLCKEETYNELIEYFKLKDINFTLPYNELKKIDEEYYSKYPRVYNPQMTKGNKYISGKGHLKHLGFTYEGGTISEERYPKSIIKFNTAKSKSKHPTQKPLALFEYLIKTYTNEGDLVLDNCVGSGTTNIACLNTNRECIGMEIDDEYFKIATTRLQEAKGQSRLF